MRVQFLYFDGCPNAANALNLLKSVLTDEGLTIDVERIRVRGQAHAQALGFLGSPSIRMNGVDIEPGARRRTQYGLMCRTYQIDDKTETLPGREQIRLGIKELG